MTQTGTRFRTLAMALGTAAVLAAQGALAQGEPKVLRVVPHSNLAILDPVWTTQYMARNHGYRIYNTLFGTDEKSKIQPQMVASWSISPDNRLYTFTLRPGLEFHDGKPVTGEDVIASLARWGKRDAMGQKLFTFVQKMDAPKPDQFRIFLGEACGFVLEALGKPSSNVPFIMPKRVADTDAFKQIEDYTGSGPCRVVEFGPAKSVFGDPQHEYTRALFAAAPGRLWLFGNAKVDSCPQPAAPGFTAT